MSRVLLYADVDLNLIDGSSVWLASLAELLANGDGMAVTVLQRTRIQRSVVIQQLLARHNVEFVDPWDAGHGDARWGEVMLSNGGPRLLPETAAGLIQLLDRERRFDVFIVRSLETAQLLSWEPQIASRLWVYITDPLQHMAEGERSALRELFGRVQRFLCQTEEAKEVFRELLDTNRHDKLTLLPPMIPAVDWTRQPRVDPEAPRLGYAGKFSPPYMIIEMLDAFDEIRVRIPNAEFHVVGDKFHNVPPTPGFEETVSNRLQNTPGVIWYGGVSREETHEILRGVHVASSWRDTLFDDSLEMSTKILEYSALGIPVLMNPSSVQARIYGAGYPGYVECDQDFIDRFIELTSSQSLYQSVSRHVQEVASSFTFERTLNNLKPVLNARQIVQTPQKQQTILFAGHDFKFLELIIEHFRSKPGCEVLTDEYAGHVIKNPEKSAALLEQADLIFCEWCLGNAEWYSHHKRAGQTLVIRLHHQEIDLHYLQQINWDNVDCLIFICPRNMDVFLERFPFMAPRVRLIYNLIDCDALAVPKLNGAEFNLGIVGIAPKRKAPHVAWEILERLKEIDRRYTLFIKGKHPREYDWLWRRPAERSYYEALFQCMDHSRYENSVVFDPHGNDMPNWFSKIGFILSTSDHEGSHQAVAEGMASGAVPIIRNWEGAEGLYPERYIFRSVENAVELIVAGRQDFPALSESCTHYAQSRFDYKIIVEQYDQLFDQIIEQRESLSHAMISPLAFA